jgi:hypothetical protein
MLVGVYLDEDNEIIETDGMQDFVIDAKVGVNLW